jgi:hypothetical protein
VCTCLQKWHDSHYKKTATMDIVLNSKKKKKKEEENVDPEPGV